MYLDLGRCMDNRICMVLEWTPEEARIDMINLLCISREHHGILRMGDLEPPDILYETCACVIHLQLHVHTPRSIFLSLLNTSEDRHSLRHSVQTETTSYWVPEDQGTGIMMSQYMKLVLVSFTLIYSATCAFNGIVILICAGYMCFVKL